MDALKKIAGLAYNYLYDLRRFWRYASNHRVGGRTQTQRLSAIIATYHVVEKGMSMPEVRLGYGQDVIRKLIIMIRSYQAAGYSTKEQPIEEAVGALKAYIDFHVERDFKLGKIAEEIRVLTDNLNAHGGGTVRLKRNEIRELGQAPFREFAQSRYSIRHYADKDVPVELIREAVVIAQKTPSVCNRQSFRVYVSKDRETKDAMLKHQSGNRGFGQSADKVIVVTADLETFFASSERNQAFIDGGLFSMSLMYALHHLGLGSCPLNWCVNAIRDRRFRAEYEIPDNEVVIMFMSVGYLPEQLDVPQSGRRPVDEIFQIR